MIGALIGLVVFLVAANVVIVALFLRELRPLVRAVIARNSGELAMSDSVAEPRIFKPTSRHEKAIPVKDARVRPMGLSG